MLQVCLAMKKKCHWAAVQIGEWLGFLINTIAIFFPFLSFFFLPDKKVSNLKELLDVAISRGSFTYRFLPRIAGSVISSTLAVGPIGHLFTRQLRFILLPRVDHRGIVLSFSSLFFSRSLSFGILTAFQFHLLFYHVPCTLAMQAS